ncbi:hypothetical protein [Dyella ginsengisoli]|uniref:hypothetical protein n=1 Tax=Dyella ginsengisoli TaxID=363848 RepID=UPI0012FD0585|nr:hypothetical protein [Dyella ginsengisoli]
MSDIRLLLKSGEKPSSIFRGWFEQDIVRTNHDIVRLLYMELDDLSESAMPAIMAWNRGASPERAGVGLTDERLDEILRPLFDELKI